MATDPTKEAIAKLPTLDEVKAERKGKSLQKATPTKTTRTGRSVRQRVDAVRGAVPDTNGSEHAPEATPARRGRATAGKPSGRKPNTVLADTIVAYLEGKEPMTSGGISKGLGQAGSSGDYARVRLACNADPRVVNKSTDRVAKYALK